jgi:hypothetical protein
MKQTDGGRNYFDELMQLRDKQRADRKDAPCVIRGDDLPWELNRIGNTRWYMAPTMENLILNTLITYIVRIPPRERTGRQLMQGGQICFIWKGGSGYTMIDGSRYDWGRWDLLQIPLRPKGCTVQHFNDSDEEVQILFCSANLVHAISVDAGSGFEVVEESPAYREHRQKLTRNQSS